MEANKKPSAFYRSLGMGGTVPQRLLRLGGPGSAGRGLQYGGIFFHCCYDSLAAQRLRTGGVPALVRRSAGVLCGQIRAVCLVHRHVPHGYLLHPPRSGGKAC